MDTTWLCDLPDDFYKSKKFDMTKWYSYPLQVITHIENDIVAGYYPNVRRVA